MSRRTAGHAWPKGTRARMLRLAFLCLYGEDPRFMLELAAIPRPPDLRDPEWRSLLDAGADVREPLRARVAARDRAIADLITTWRLDRIPEGPDAVRDWLDDRDWYARPELLDFPPGASWAEELLPETFPAGKGGEWDVHRETRREARLRIRRETGEAPADLDSALEAAEAAGWEWIDAPNDPDATRRLLRLLYRHVAYREEYEDVAEREAAEAGTYVDPDSLRSTAGRLAREAGIRLADV